MFTPARSSSSRYAHASAFGQPTALNLNYFSMAPDQLAGNPNAWIGKEPQPLNLETVSLSTADQIRAATGSHKSSFPDVGLDQSPARKRSATTISSTSQAWTDSSGSPRAQRTRSLTNAQSVSATPSHKSSPFSQNITPLTQISALGIPMSPDPSIRQLEDIDTILEIAVKTTDLDPLPPCASSVANAANFLASTVRNNYETLQAELKVSYSIYNQCCNHDGTFNDVLWNQFLERLRHNYTTLRDGTLVSLLHLVKQVMMWYALGKRTPGAGPSFFATVPKLENEALQLREFCTQMLQKLQNFKLPDHNDLRKQWLTAQVRGQSVSIPIDHADTIYFPRPQKRKLDQIEATDVQGMESSNYQLQNSNASPEPSIPDE